MVYNIYYGELTEEAREHWTEVKETKDLLSWREEMHTNDWMYFFQDARECFSDQISVDWGTTAWKATAAQLLAWEQRSGNSLGDPLRVQLGKVYGVVFIEMS